jgi:hypothetical protein
MNTWPAGVPAEVLNHYADMPNNVRALYATFKSTFIPFVKREERIEAMGQLCFDEAACRAVAYHMHNKRMENRWQFVSWRCEMDGPLIGDRAKLNGIAPSDFDIYGPRNVPVDCRRAGRTPERSA